MALELVTPFTKVELEKKEKDKNRKQIGILGGNFNPVHKVIPSSEVVVWH